MRNNTAAIALESLDLGWFKASPYIASNSGVCVHPGKPSLAPKYTGPYKIKRKNWDNNTFLLDLGRKEDVVLLSQLKAASVQAEAT